VIARRAVVAGLGAASIGRRNAWARRFVTMITAAPAGSSGDDIARLFAQFLASALNGPEIQIRNVPGDGGRTALNTLADAPPSGATFGWVATPVLPARSVDRGDPLLPGRLTLLGSVQREPIAFVAAASDPLESVRDMIDRANQDSGGLPLGTPPPGSPSHLAVLRLQVMTQTRLNIIAFPSAAAARQALLGGNVTAAALGLSDAIAALRDEKLVGLGIAAHKRSGILPDMPILSEAGVPLSAWIRRGLAVPADTPREAAEALTAALRSVAEDPAFRDQTEVLGLLAAWTDGPAWTEHTEQERQELATLWAADPWLNAAGQ
jgi:tripartite-type tricarboxylate transporter receptor subunit TctC